MNLIYQSCGKCEPESNPKIKKKKTRTAIYLSKNHPNLGQVEQFNKNYRNDDNKEKDIAHGRNISFFFLKPALQSLLR